MPYRMAVYQIYYGYFQAAMDMDVKSLLARLRCERFTLSKATWRASQDETHHTLVR